MTKRLKGGWFTGPEEYQSMGFTLGLPPGLYLPHNQELEEAVKKILPLNGILLPSYFKIKNSAQTDENNMIIVSNIPPRVTEKNITLAVYSILETKVILPPDIDEAILLCTIDRSSSTALVKLYSPHLVKIAVSFSSLPVGKDLLPISYPNFLGSYLNSKLKEYHDAFSIHCLVFVAENNNSTGLPNDVDISFEIGKYADIKKIFRPKGFNYVIIYFDSQQEVDFLYSSFKEIKVRNTNFKIYKSKRDKSEADLLTDPIIREQAFFSVGETSSKIAVLTPYFQKNANVADIFDLGMQTTTVINKETELIQPSSGKTLRIFNIIPKKILTKRDTIEIYLHSIASECGKYGNVIDCKASEFFKTELESNYGVVEVQFGASEEAKACQIAISGRRFNGRLVITQLVE